MPTDLERLIEDFAHGRIGLDPQSSQQRRPSWDFIGVPEGFMPRTQVLPRNIPDRIADPQSTLTAVQNRGRVTVSPWEIPGFWDMTPQQQAAAMRAKAEQKRREQLRTGIRTVEPRYRAGDEVREFMRLDPRQRAQLQRDLAAMGLINEYREGILDSATAGAFQFVLGVANQTGTTWNNALLQVGRQAVIDMRDQAEQSPDPTFGEPTYLAPDYASLKQQVKNLFRNQLRRDPTEAELAALSDELSTYHRRAWEAEVEARRRDFYTGREAAEGEETTSTTVQSTDPASQFLEMFEDKYDSAIRTEQAEDDNDRAMNLFMQSLNIGQNAMTRGVV
jgi:hypothetical protein